MKWILLIASTGLVLWTPPAAAEVIDNAANGFTVKIAFEVQSPSAKAYAAIVDVAKWWDPEHTYSGRAANLRIDATPGGCFCEKLPDGGGVRHLTVVYVEPGKVLRMSGGLGPMQDMAVAGSMNITLSESGGQTAVVLTYKAGGYLPGGLDAMAKPADGMLTGAMQRLRRYIVAGHP